MKEDKLRKIIDELQQELREIAYAIRTLESVASGKGRRGRPPKWMAKLPAGRARKPDGK